MANHRAFLLVVTDRDHGRFTIEGPMTDDTPWIDAVESAQKLGRQINCHTPGTGTSREVAKRITQELGLIQAESGSIVRPSN